MDVSDLTVFCAVVESGGITRAAERLHRVPSNVTTRVRQLEEDLGVPLFVREGRRLVITPAGKTLFDYARRISALMQEAHEALHESTPRGVLRLGSMESSAATLLPGPLAEYHKRYPDVALQLSTGATGPLLTRLLAGDLEAVVIADPPQDERLESVSIAVEELGLIADAQHPPIRKPEDVCRPTLLAFGNGCAYRQRLQAWFGASTAGMPSQVIEMASYHAILACAAAGMGIALVPGSILQLFPDRARLSEHELPPGQRTSETALVWRKGARSVRIAALAEVFAQAGMGE